MKNVISTINNLLTDFTINIKSIYNTLAGDKETYKFKLRGDVYYCYVVVVRGALQIHTTNRYDIKLKEGQGVFLWSNEVDQYTFYGDDCEHFWVYFSLKGADLILSKSFNISNLSKTIKTIRQCSNLLIKKTLVDSIRANALFTSCILEGIEKNMQEENDSEPIRQNIILNSVNYINDNLFNDINIQDLANEANLSLRRYTVYFQEIMGVSPSKYIAIQKMKIAKDYLVNSNLSISQIAYNLRFSSVFYFTNCFKKYFNCSPSVYRINNKKL